MNKSRLLACAWLTLGIVTWGAHADEKRYISDDLTTYIHSGPGNQYRITGTLHSGDEVTLKSVDTSTNFAQIVDAKGHDAWISLDQLSSTPSLRIQVPDLQQQVKTLTDKLSDIDNNWKQRTAEIQQIATSREGIINDLKQENEDLKNQLIVAQKKVNAINIQLDDKRRTIILQWLMYGGGVAGVGLILGLLLPHLIPQRKKKDRWMR